MPMLKKIRKNLIKNKKGFTLIEMLVVLSLFTSVILIATNIYMSVTQIQTRVASLQKVQEDIRFTMESMAQSIRLGKINYDFYLDPNDDDDYTDAIDLHHEATTPVDILALIDQTGNYIFYRKSSDKLQFCNGTLSNCGLADGDWQDITPKGVEVKVLNIIITPSADPSQEVSLENCPCDGSYLSYRCVGGTCKYYSDGQNFQPKVKIILKTESPGERPAEKATMQLQTIVSTRIPQNEVKNTYYD